MSCCSQCVNNHIDFLGADTQEPLVNTVAEWVAEDNGSYVQVANLELNIYYLIQQTAHSVINNNLSFMMSLLHVLASTRPSYTHIFIYL